jgi:pseudaminic acid cytidylyltransferase
MINRIAIIPARAGSKRIKNKNLIYLKGKKLIFHTLDQIKKSNMFKNIHISTESLKIKKIVEKKNFNVDFLRPKKLADDKTPLKKVVNFTIKEYSKKKINFDEVWLFFITNPFLSTKHIKNAYKLYKTNKKKYSIMSVSEYNYPINWALKENKNSILKPLFTKKIRLIKKKIYCEAGMFVIYQKNYLKSKNKLKYKPYKIPLWGTVDIDTREDFILASKLKN